QGKKAVIQSVPVLTAGTYTITVGGVMVPFASFGGYSVQLILNAAAEAEANDGPSNNTRGTAQDLSPSFLTLQTPQGSAEHAAVVGQLGGAEDDYYLLNLAAG